MDRPLPASATRRRVGRSSGAWFAIAIILIADLAFALNNLAPYLGLDYAGAMTMYSGLAPGGANHLFMPRLPLSDADTYVAILDVGVEDLEAPEAGLFRRLATPRDGVRPLVHLNFVRYHASRACGAAPSGRLKLALLTDAGRAIDVADACAEPALLRYAFLSSYPPCKNRPCERALRLWREDVDWNG
jgi:hypothetical protein